MKSAVILCNGEFPKREYPLYLLRTADIIVCCDSQRNVARLKKLGLEPTVILGDMDSTPPTIQKEYASRIVRISGQEDNDLAKAYAYLLEHYADVGEVHILAAGGKNESHTIANLGWLMEWVLRSATKADVERAATNEQPSTPRVDMVSDYSTAFALYGQSNVPAELHIGQGRKVSFFSTDQSLRLSTTGLVWPLHQIDLSRWWAGTRNCASSDIVTLQFNHPAPLLVILD